MNSSSAQNVDNGKRVGLVDGAVDATTRRFSLLLDDDAVVQLDDLIAVSHPLPDGSQITHYGIVVEGYGAIEGAQLATDTRRITHDMTMPGETIRRVDVQILRTDPELWLPPAPGAVAHRAVGAHRRSALFLDQMEKPLAVGYDQSEDPVFADFAFINGEKGGHVSISGISGVATKTSYALFLLYMLFETEQGRLLLGPAGAETKALVFNVKGEDLLWIDRPNIKFATNQRAHGQWQKLGVDDPAPFRSVELFVPRAASSKEGSLDIKTGREVKDITPYGWSPKDFVTRGLLRFCFADASDARNQISFIEQRVRVQLARWAHPMRHESGAIVLAAPPPGTTFNLDRLLEHWSDKPEVESPLRNHPDQGWALRDFSDLVDFLTAKLSPDVGAPDPAWTAGVQEGTVGAFLRRLYAQVPRIGHLIWKDLRSLEFRKQVNVVDIHSLHDDAQRFVVGSLLSELFESKQRSGREPLRFILLDELNKYAPREGMSPIKEILVDIAQRGRSLGVILIGAQQSAHDVEPTVFRNAAIKVAGRLDAGESSEYKFLSPELRERASRFLPGTMVLDQPLIPAPIPIRFPFPPFATNVAEGRIGHTDEHQVRTQKLFEQLGRGD